MPWRPIDIFARDRIRRRGVPYRPRRRHRISDLGHGHTLRAEKKQQCKNAAGDPHAAHLLADLHLEPAHVLQKSLPLGHRFLGRFMQVSDQVHSRSSDYTSTKWQNPFVASLPVTISMAVRHSSSTARPRTSSAAAKAAPSCTSCGRRRARPPTIAAIGTPSRVAIACRRLRAVRYFASSNIRRTLSASLPSRTKKGCPTTAPAAPRPPTATIRGIPGFHKTATIDYAIVLSGEIFAMMDDGEVLLQTGDVLIQRGTNHAWSNRTNETRRRRLCADRR